MALPDDIINELRKQPGLTGMEITVNILGRRQYFHVVHRECRRLVDAGHLKRRGKGGPRDPFTYHLPR